MQEWRNRNTYLLQTQSFEGSMPSSCTLCPGGETGKRSSLRHLCSSSLRVRLPPWVLRCDATTGNGPVLKTGDPSCGLGVRVPLTALWRHGWIGKSTSPLRKGRVNRHVGSRPTVSARMSLMSIILKFYTISLMTNPFFHDILGSGIKQGHRSGKERQCCRYIRIVSWI